MLQESRNRFREPPISFWRDPASYETVLARDFLAPLRAAANSSGSVPLELQQDVLRRLHWYFTVDARERAPTVIVDEAMAETLHRHVQAIMAHIEPSSLQRLDEEPPSPEVRHALLSYHGQQRHSAPVIDAFDHDRQLVRVSYWVHGEPPKEQFRIDGKTVAPAFAKYRACNFYRRRLLRQRIVWLDARAGRGLEVSIDDRRLMVSVGKARFSLEPTLAATGEVVDLQQVRQALPPGHAASQQALGWTWADLKVRIVKMLARFPPVRRHYRDAWLFIDRDDDAGDNAEHLFRWVREHHPEVNAWYLLRPDSPDWPRLHAEGFRLLRPGLARRLAALNCDHVVSSHVGHAFGMNPTRYGDMMRWRYTFLQHGVTYNDVSHWLNPASFDTLITASPAEQDWFTGDDTPFIYTGRETYCTGFPRHDELIRLARQTPVEAINRLVVMPTWRASLVDGRAEVLNDRDRLRVFSSSPYAQHWRSLLNSVALRQLAREVGWKLTFIPHVNAVPFLEAFELPEDIDVVQLSSGLAQEVFSQTAVFITDYTSVAFDIALLRRPIVYYQFDRDEFYRGGHNWREGRFSYEREGFGPVLLTEDRVIEYLRSLSLETCAASSVYFARMELAMPDFHGNACRQTFEACASR